jgi:hypothetical protein
VWEASKKKFCSCLNILKIDSIPLIRCFAHWYPRFLDSGVLWFAEHYFLVQFWRINLVFLATLSSGFLSFCEENLKRWEGLRNSLQFRWVHNYSIVLYIWIQIWNSLNMSGPFCSADILKYGYRHFELYCTICGDKMIICRRLWTLRFLKSCST